jgi:nucleotide-binding universal stress UspA family protein
MTERTEVKDLWNLTERRVSRHKRNFSKVREILVPTDLTLESRKAIGYAASLAKTLNAHLTLLHVYKEPHSLEYMRGPNVCAARERQRQYTENALEVLGKRAKEEYADCSTEFREGDLCQEIANSVKELPADLMVISTRGSKWLQRVAYGCDADAIVRLSPCPVLVVH